MSGLNGDPTTKHNIPAIPMIQLVIEFFPTTGQINVKSSTPMDVVAMFGLLEFAKIAVNEARAQQAKDQRVVIPQMGIRGA